MRDETLLSRLLQSDNLRPAERQAFLDMSRRGYSLTPRQRAWAQRTAGRVGILGVPAVDWPDKLPEPPKERARDPHNLSSQRRGRIEQEAEQLSREIQAIERRNAFARSARVR